MRLWISRGEKVIKWAGLRNVRDLGQWVVKTRRGFSLACSFTLSTPTGTYFLRAKGYQFRCVNFRILPDPTLKFKNVLVGRTWNDMVLAKGQTWIFEEYPANFWLPGEVWLFNGKNEILAFFQPKLVPKHKTFMYDYTKSFLNLEAILLICPYFQLAQFISVGKGYFLKKILG